MSVKSERQTLLGHVSMYRELGWSETRIRKTLYQTLILPGMCDSMGYGSLVRKAFKPIIAALMAKSTARGSRECI
jgi:hypothetical protein